MKELFIKYKGVLKFLSVFIGSYVLLTLLYAFYLKSSTTPDSYTKHVSNQVIYWLNFVGYQATSTTNNLNGYIDLFIQNKLIAGIAEGCNAISIKILFTAFVVAFAKNLKTTLLFIFSGLIGIYIMNIIRIIILVICIYHLPKYTEPLHSYIFPGMIYTAVFLLWMLWVKSFKKRA